MPKIVVVGGGVSGLMTTKALAGKGYDVTLVSSTRYFEWGIAGAYSLTHPDELEKAVAGEITVPDGVKLVVGTAVSLRNQEVALKDGQVLPFDALVVATGLDLPLFRPKVGQSWADRRKQVSEIGNAVRKAFTVVIGGGGTVAVEFAGDVREVNPSAKIILVCSGDRACPYLDEKYSAKLDAKLKELNIDVMTNQRAAEEDYSVTRKAVRLQSGKTIEADCYIPAYTRAYGGAWSGLADAAGKMLVNQYLQVESKSTVFAVGCSTRSGMSAIPKIQGEADTVAKNVLKLLEGAALEDHVDSMPTAIRPISQKIGHNTFAWLDPSQLPAAPGFMLRNCGFPCCPPLLCWPLVFCGFGNCHPFFCGYCCSDPEGQGTALGIKMMLLHPKGMVDQTLGTAPAQLEMGKMGAE